MRKYTIIFDLGGVIADIKVAETISCLRELGLQIPSDPNIEREPMTSISQMGDIALLINKMDIGELSGRDFGSYLQQACNRNASVEDIINVYNRLISIPQNRLKWIASLRAKFQVLLLSNIGDLHWEYFQTEAERMGYPISTLFDKIYVSYKLHLAKPSPAIFQHMITNSGISPEDSLYIDDLEDNINIGRQFGLNTIHINSNTLEQHMEEIEHWK